MFRKLFGLGRRQRTDCRPATVARRRHRTLSLEQLEPRTAPAVNVFISGGVLNVIGDSDADTIMIDHDALRSLTVVTRSAPTPLTLTFSDNSFTRIEINPGSWPFGDTVNIRGTAKPTSVTTSPSSTILFRARWRCCSTPGSR